MAQVLIAPPDQSGPLREILGFVADAMGVEVKDHPPDGITIDGAFHYAEDYREPEQDENRTASRSRYVGDAVRHAVGLAAQELIAHAPPDRPYAGIAREAPLRSDQWRLHLILPRHLRMQ